MSTWSTFHSVSKRVQLPLSRDQTMLLIAAFNEIMLGVDTYLAHALNQTIRLREWIPILFGFISGAFLLAAGLLARRSRATASFTATAVFAASVIVGILGAYFHLIRGTLPSAPLGEQITLDLLIWAPPVLAPFAFAGIGIVGMSAAWPETPADSGTLKLPFGWHLHLPFSKTQAYYFLVSMGILVALISSVFDHARHRWQTPWLWLPVVVGVFGVVVSAGMGWMGERTSRADVYTYAAAMVLLLLVGLIGAYFHIRADLTAQNIIVPERFLRGAPFLSPLFFSNMGMVGLIALLPSQETA